MKHSKKFAGKHHPGMEDLLSTTFVLFSQQEQGRLLAARSSLADAAGWGSMKLYKEQPEGAESEARKEIYQQVRAQLAEMGTPISEDEALLASLQTSTSAAGNGAGTHVSQHISLNGGQPHDDSGDEWHSEDVSDSDVQVEERERLHMQVAALRYRLERKYVRRAMLGLLATMAYAEDDLSLMQDLSDNPC